MEHNNKHIMLPTLIPSLTGKNVIDIQCAGMYSFALCASQINVDTIPLIAKQWCSQTIYIPNDIIVLIYKYMHHTTEVYSCGYSSSCLHGHDQGYSPTNEFSGKRIVTKWTKIKKLNNKNIIKIATAACGTLFLEDNGILWYCQRNTPFVALSVHQYFIERKLKVKDIAAGYDHYLIVDGEGKLYAYGHNHRFQCARITINYSRVEEPEIVDMFEFIPVKEIGCGHMHSYVVTENNQHFLFGDNEHKECIHSVGYGIYYGYGYARKPYYINDIIEKTIGKRKIIKQISLGNKNTKIILCDANI
eukprot:1645_1